MFETYEAIDPSVAALLWQNVNQRVAAHGMASYQELVQALIA